MVEKKWVTALLVGAAVVEMCGVAGADIPTPNGVLLSLTLLLCTRGRVVGVQRWLLYVGLVALGWLAVFTGSRAAHGAALVAELALFSLLCPESFTGLATLFYFVAGWSVVFLSFFGAAWRTVDELSEYASACLGQFMFSTKLDFGPTATSLIPALLVFSLGCAIGCGRHGWRARFVFACSSAAAAFFIVLLSMCLFEYLEMQQYLRAALLTNAFTLGSAVLLMLATRLFGLPELTWPRIAVRDRASDGVTA